MSAVIANFPRITKKHDIIGVVKQILVMFPANNKYLGNEKRGGGYRSVMLMLSLFCFNDY